MLTLKFKDKGIDFEIIGEVDELINFLNKYPWESTTAKPIIQTKPAPLAKPPTELKPNEEIKSYILEKPNFTHNLFEIQKEFYGCAFNSRAEKRMYHKTARQLRLIRKQIEKEHNGEFHGGLVKGRITQYTFKKPRTLQAAYA